MDGFKTYAIFLLISVSFDVISSEVSTTLISTDVHAIDALASSSENGTTGNQMRKKAQSCGDCNSPERQVDRCDMSCMAKLSTMGSVKLCFENCAQTFLLCKEVCGKRSKHT